MCSGAPRRLAEFRVEVWIRPAGRDQPFGTIIDRQRERACVSPRSVRPVRAGAGVDIDIEVIGEDALISRQPRKREFRVDPTMRAQRRSHEAGCPVAAAIGCNNAAVHLLEKAEHGGHARLEPGEEQRRIDPQTQQQFLDRMYVDQRIGKRFRAAADVTAIGQYLACTLGLEHGEALLKQLAPVLGRSAAQAQGHGDAEARHRISFIDAAELEVADLSAHRFQNHHAAFGGHRLEQPRPGGKQVDQAISRDAETPGKVVPFAERLDPRRNQRPPSPFACVPARPKVT